MFLKVLIPATAPRCATGVVPVAFAKRAAFSYNLKICSGVISHDGLLLPRLCAGSASLFSFLSPEVCGCTLPFRWRPARSPSGSSCPGCHPRRRARPPSHGAGAHPLPSLPGAGTRTRSAQISDNSPLESAPCSKSSLPPLRPPYFVIALS